MNCSPKALAQNQSLAATEFAFDDAKADILELHTRVKDLETVIIKMIQCNEQNTIALAKSVGIDLPVTGQPCKHNWQSIDPEHVTGVIECQACGTRTISSPVKVILPNPAQYNCAQDLGADFCDAIQPAIDAGVIEVMEE